MKILWASLSIALLAAFPAPGTAQAKKKFKVLVATMPDQEGHPCGKRNGKPLSLLEETITQIGKESRLWETEYTTTGAELFDPAKMKSVDAVFCYTLFGYPPGPFNNLLEWIRDGGAWLGSHGASTAYGGGNMDYIREIVGCQVAGHPWGGQAEPMTNHDPSHPASAAFPAEFTFADEVYNWNLFYPDSVRVLYSINMLKTGIRIDKHNPVAWVRENGKGRIFFTALGHSDSTWTNPLFRKHLLGAFRWTLRLEEKGPAGPNPEVGVLEDAKAYFAVAVQGAGHDPAALAPVLEARLKVKGEPQKFIEEIKAVREGSRPVADVLKTLSGGR